MLKGGVAIEFGDILGCSSILLVPDLSFVMVWIWFIFWLIPLILSLSNLSCISVNIVSVGVESCIFYFVAFLRIMKDWSKNFAKYDDDDKV